MNDHIIVEQHPHALLHMAISAIFSCSVFFTMGYFARPIIDRLLSFEAVPICVAVAETPRRTMQWTTRKPD